MRSHNKPSLSAWPSHVVQLGLHVELQCDSHRALNMFKVHKECGDPNSLVNERIFQRSLVLGPVTSAYAGIYRCYGFNDQSLNEISEYSDPLEIIISGIYRKPFLLALQTPLLNSGEKVTLECRSEILFDTFILSSKREEIIKLKHSAESHLGGSHANFSIGPVTPDHAGTYTCYGSYNHNPYEWSHSSDPVDIKITGLYKKPSLSGLTQQGPVVMSGKNMTLACISDHQFDMFHLSMEGVPQGHGLPAMQIHNGTFQANFLVNPEIQEVTYRCYGSFRNSSHVWSYPSDPLYIPVTGNHKNLHILAGLSVTMILVFLIILYSYCSAKKNKSQEQATNMDQESEVRTTLNREDPERQEMQEVAYTEFDQITFKQKLTTQVSQFPKEFPTYPSAYLEIRR
ncbi:killer cell immunoglobulin-like receptor 3DL1 isoform X2 [Cricetulus griseus]|uniref:Killer cell immunoglobulin-like receptor 3DL1 isoform X2 n=1 Tax=Cricetulus griseus TaxID=10029 RepID=A0A9J7KCR4_CRIGR|nr:killer cell immunoglobulin-like receptor 3DL1 isoform X2 [Cricetulus griseus]